jgi:hypothetical protein
MQRFIDAVNSANEQKNWLAALTLAITLPDICGQLENPQSGSEVRFVAWWNKYLLPKYTRKIGPRQEEHVFLSGGDAYALRCAYLHEGSDDVLNQRARVALEKFHFITPPQSGMIHRNQINNALQLQVDVFCKEICGGVSQWLKDNENSTEITSRCAALLTVHDSSKGV